ncbi:hypothetical protein [Clostridium ljungdahlii]|uniref:Uncharacterized protein n=1 Tax=Clostridium ljungdahlii TaxID=1538 RepID=A0A170NLC5_9CLOT|nr:hypothetical protein [Clostridium ljungdahlii]OAA92188.1 hypothetical protein WY13_00277 [Clostridium ljungdahlii]
MDINVFKIKVKKEKAIKMARGLRSTFMGLSNKKISDVRMHYVEVKFITCNLTYRPNFIEKYLFKDNEIKQQKILMIADGSTCEVAIVSGKPNIVSIKNVEENYIQPSSYSDEIMINNCKKIASRVVRRNMGSFAEVDFEKIESCYRPYWLILYGGERGGKNPKCIPVCADGCGSYRSF